MTRSLGGGAWGARQLLAALLCAVHASASPSPSAAPADEAALKAAIVFNLMLFIEWPAQTQPAAGGALHLCVGPHSAMLAALKALNRHELRGLRLEVRELADDPPRAAQSPAPPPQPCHAVFVDAADQVPLAAALKAQRETGALLLSDDAQAPADSTAIVLQRQGTRIGFEVNLRPVRQAHVQLSSKLLRLARMVRE